MREPHIEGIASHDVPESCAGVREDQSEVLTGVHMGTVLSREIRRIGAPTSLSEAEGNIGLGVIASTVRAPRGRRPVARVEPSCARTGRSLNSSSNTMARRGASGRPKAVRR